MISTFQLECVARDLGISIVDTSLPTGVKGYYCESIGCQNYILLSDKLTRTERRCVLAEELGHCLLNVGTPHGFSGLKQELTGRRWAYWQLADVDDITQACRNGARNRWEIAQALDVTEEFLNEAIEDFLNRGYRFCYEIA